MPIFISYSHHDAKFVDKLAAQLVFNKARVWVDRWELNVGDSLIARVQDALKSASALIVVLSNASVDSEWCKKELSAGLIRELEERRVIVLPVLLEECDLPIFLKDKLYADFRSDFDKGLKTTLEAIARVTSDAQGRIESPEWHVDWAIDWGYRDERFFLRVTAVEQGEDKPYCVLCEWECLANDVATKRYDLFREKGFDWIERLAILGLIYDAMRTGGHHFNLEDQFPKTREGVIRDPKRDAQFHLRISARRMGADNGKDTFFDYGEQFAQLFQQASQVLRQPTREEKMQIKKFLKELG